MTGKANRSILRFVRSCAKQEPIGTCGSSRFVLDNKVSGKALAAGQNPRTTGG